MRPLELRLRNFRSYYGEDSVFDFRDRGLVGVVGPIGSGKSSLLDAIAFALFGRTPTVAATTKSLIHQRADRATVSLRFSVDTEIWEVTRALRRKGQSAHGLTRLAADDADAEKLETLVLEGEVNERIVELLGLEFDGFSRSIMLAQGRFAEFLSSRPAERDKVLKGVFGHDRIDVMRTAAKDRAAAAAADVEAIGIRLEAADALAMRIAESKELLAAAEARLELLRKAEAKFADHAERLEATGRIIAHAETRLGEIASLAERIPAADDVATTVGIAQSANETRERIGKVLEEAQVALADADAVLIELEPASLRQRIDDALRLEAALSQLQAQEKVLATRLEAGLGAIADLEDRRQSASIEMESARTASRAAQDAVAEATSAHSEALGALHEAQHANMAATLRRALRVDEPCPVCAQEVTALPTEAASPQAEAAHAAVLEREAELAQARAAAQAAAERMSGAGQAVAAIEAEVKAARRDHAELATRVDAAKSEQSALAEELKVLTGDISASELRKRLEAAEVAVTDARKRVDIARAEHDEAIRSAVAAEKELAGLRLALAEISTRLGVEAGPTDDALQVAAAVEAMRAAWLDATDTLATAKTAAERERSEIGAADRALRKELGISGDFTKHLAETAAATELRRQQLATDEETLAASDQLRATRQAAEKRRAIYDALAADLTDSKFVRYLLDEEKRDLANLGSEHFERLSSGRYRFSTDGEFRIVDLTSADAIRKADSLSGGETFLASLALALALAEMVARTGGRLDAFFLDEGFGSLDPEHLDLAMEGIEQLAAGATDRLVLVVSHVADMRDRLEDIIELDRNPVTGDTVVVHA